MTCRAVQTVLLLCFALATTSAWSDPQNALDNILADLHNSVQSTAEEITQWATAETQKALDNIPATIIAGLAGTWEGRCSTKVNKNIVCAKQGDILRFPITVAIGAKGKTPTISFTVPETTVVGRSGALLTAPAENTPKLLLGLKFQYNGFNTFCITAGPNSAAIQVDVQATEVMIEGVLDLTTPVATDFYCPSYPSDHLFCNKKAGNFRCILHRKRHY